MTKDVSWLGGEADAAPLARLGIGIMIAGGVRSVPTDPSELRRVLSKIIPSSNIARWTYAREIEDADEWLEPALAIAISEDLKRKFPRLRVRVEQAIWQHPEELRIRVIEDLVRAVGVAKIFTDWSGPQAIAKPLVDRGGSHSFTVRCSNELRDKWARIAPFFPSTLVEEDGVPTDIHITTAGDCTGPLAPALLVVLVGLNVNEAVDMYLNFRKQHRARCLIHVPIEVERSGDWLYEFFLAWHIRSLPIDLALDVANHQGGGGGRFVATTQSFILKSFDFFSTNYRSSYIKDFSSAQLPYKEVTREREQESPISSEVPSPRGDIRLLDEVQSPFLSRISSGAAISGTYLSRGDTATPRVLDARIMVGAKLIRRLPLSGFIDIRVDIRPRKKLNEDRQIFPDERVNWDGHHVTLRVHMLEIGQEPLSRDIVAPQYGRSESASFPYLIRGTRMDLRFIVSDGVRILQTARLKGEPGEWVHFEVESIAAPVAEEKSDFNIALLVNDSLGQIPSVTSLTGAGIELTPLTSDEVKCARTEMLAILESAVVSVDTPIDRVLLQLGALGRCLLNHLRKHVQGWPTCLGRIQLTTQSDAFFPLEYLYDGSTPLDPDALMCEEREGCLSMGRARPNCLIRAANEVFCPMGFLGLTSIIERQTWKSGAAPGIWLAAPKKNKDREQVTAVEPILFCASDQADDFGDQITDSAGKLLLKTSDVVADLDCTRACSWDQWLKDVRSRRPPLLMLIVHIEDGCLHLGTSDRVLIASINESFVGPSRPIVIAIGCSSGQRKTVSAGLPAILMSEGARVVISAMTDVLGRHANRAALDLAKALQQAVSSSSVKSASVGELIATIRRKLIADNVALGLALVAYGDADVTLLPAQQLLMGA